MGRKRENNLSNLKYRFIADGIGAGLLAGILVSAFRLALTKIDEIRGVLLEGAQTKLSLVICCLLLLFFFTVWVSFIVTREPLCTGSGIPQVKGELEGEIKANWLSVIIAKFIGGVMAVGGGLSLFASGNPDGLEWSMFGNSEAGYSENMGLDEEAYGISSKTADAAEAIQEKTAFLPDYAFSGSDSAAGTSVSGLVGSAIVAGAAVLICMLGGFFRRKKSCHG